MITSLLENHLRNRRNPKLQIWRWRIWNPQLITCSVHSSIPHNGGDRNRWISKWSHFTYSILDDVDKRGNHENGCLTTQFIVRTFNRWGSYHNRSAKPAAHPFPLKELLLPPLAPISTWQTSKDKLVKAFDNLMYSSHAILFCQKLLQLSIDVNFCRKFTNQKYAFGSERRNQSKGAFLLGVPFPLSPVCFVLSLFLAPHSPAHLPPQLRLLRKVYRSQNIWSGSPKRVWNVMTDQNLSKVEVNIRSLIKRWAM